MHAEQIKAAIRMKGTTPSAIADELGLSRSTVSQVINGRGISARVSQKISEVVGLPIAEIWTQQPPSLLRRPSAKRSAV